jgi:hypothetical protein
VLIAENDSNQFYFAKYSLSALKFGWFLRVSYLLVVIVGGGSRIMDHECIRNSNASMF